MRERRGKRDGEGEEGGGMGWRGEGEVDVYKR